MVPLMTMEEAMFNEYSSSFSSFSWGMSLVNCPLRLSGGIQDFCYYTGAVCVPADHCQGWIDTSPKLIEKVKGFDESDLELFVMMNKDAYKERKKKSYQIRKRFKSGNK